MSDREQKFWEERFRTTPGICAVGRKDISQESNEQQYAEAAQQFLGLVREDFPKERVSALEFGFGYGHYSKLCQQVGFREYLGLDFASPVQPYLGDHFSFAQQDIGVSFDLGKKFDLVLAIDVIYHVLVDSEFDTALDNMRRHAAKRIYVTGLFVELNHRHCHHRPMERFERLGRLIDVRPWRDNKIARFDVVEAKEC